MIKQRTGKYVSPTFQKTTPPATKPGIASTKREEFLSNLSSAGGSPYTSTPRTDRFDLKPAGSAFVKEYTYIQDTDENRKNFSPKDYGFTYTEKGKAAAQSAHKDDLPSPTGKRLTGYAFTYKPPETDKTSPTSPTSQTEVKKTEQKGKPVSPGSGTKHVTYSPGKETFIVSSPVHSKLPTKSSPIPVKIKDDKSKKSSVDQKSSYYTSPKEATKQSKDSKLETSSSSSSLSSGSSMDEYERETVVRDPSIVLSPGKTSSGKPYKTTKTGKEQSIERARPFAQPSGPKITHVSRKRVVTNADGTVEEMEEIIEPKHGETITKPVIIGVVPSTGIKPHSTKDSVVKFAGLLLINFHSLDFKTWCLINLFLFNLTNFQILRKIN